MRILMMITVKRVLRNGYASITRKSIRQVCVMSTEMDMSALGAMNVVSHMAIGSCVGQESQS